MSNSVETYRIVKSDDGKLSHIQMIGERPTSAAIHAAAEKARELDTYILGDPDAGFAGRVPFAFAMKQNGSRQSARLFVKDESGNLEAVSAEYETLKMETSAVFFSRYIENVLRIRGFVLYGSSASSERAKSLYDSVSPPPRLDNASGIGKSF